MCEREGEREREISCVAIVMWRTTLDRVRHPFYYSFSCGYDLFSLFYYSFPLLSESSSPICRATPLPLISLLHLFYCVPSDLSLALLLLLLLLLLPCLPCLPSVPFSLPWLSSLVIPSLLFLPALLFLFCSLYFPPLLPLSSPSPPPLLPPLLPLSSF